MRTLKGAMGMLDQLMEQKNFEAEDIVNQFHKLLTEGRMNLDDVLLAKIMISLANCEVSVYKTSQPRIELGEISLDVASYSAT